jgi:hypothetical protein
MVSLNDVLLAMSNIPVDDPIAEMWGAMLRGGYTPIIVEYTGTLPITINANGEALIDYRIYGNTVQDGVPTPESPVNVVGCGERTENLFDAATAYGAMYSGGVITGLSGNINDIKNKVTADMIGKTYTISITSLEIPSRAFLTIVVNGTIYWRENELAVNQRRSFQFTPVTENDLWYITYDTSGIASYKDIMLNLGSTALLYEPYGYKLPMTVSDGNTAQTIPIYLGEVETTRRIKKLVLTGQERYQNYSYASTNGVQIINMFETVYIRASGLCNIYPVSTVAGSTSCVWIGSGGGDRNLYFVSILSDMGMSTVDKFKSYVQQQYAAGTPVTVWYVLDEPETGIVNEPLMKIGDYADTIDSSQTAVQMPTIDGTTVIDYDGEPKPSQVYIKYKGKGAQ